MLSRLFKLLDDTEIAACGEFAMHEMEDEVLSEHSDDFWKDSQDGKPPEKIPIQVTQQSGESPLLVIDLEWGWSASTCTPETEPLATKVSDEISVVVYEPFLSKVTLNGLRVTILSTIDVVELLLRENYKYVLTGKLNQDCIEVSSDILRIISHL